MAKANLTDPFVRNLSPPVRGQISYWDDSLPGFGLRVSQGGAKTWIVLDPRSKVRTQETIGRYPLISLQDARGEAKRRLAEATLGKHRTRSIRWSEAVDMYLREVEKRRKPRTHADYKRLLKHFNFAATMLSDIAPHDIQKRLDKLARTPSEQQHAFVAVRAFVNWCYEKHYVDENPMRRMRAPPPSKPRERVLSDDELGKVWRAAGDDVFGRIVKVCILTGLRRSEAASLTPQMLKDDLLTIPETKNGRAHTLPCSTLVAGLIGDGLKFNGWGKCKDRLDKACGVSGWRLHDLRRSFRTGLGSLGVAPHIGERLVNHKAQSGVEAIYDRHKYFGEQKAALEAWESKVLALEAEPDFEENILRAASN